MNARSRAGELTLGTRVRMNERAQFGVVEGVHGIPLTQDMDVHIVLDDGVRECFTVPASLLVEVASCRA